jgi:hypothetical protein
VTPSKEGEHKSLVSTKESERATASTKESERESLVPPKESERDR